MKIHTCYKLFGKADTPIYPHFKALNKPKLIDGVSYDIYNLASIIDGVYTVATIHILQNTKFDIQSKALEVLKNEHLKIKSKSV